MSGSSLMLKLLASIEKHPLRFQILQTLDREKELCFNTLSAMLEVKKNQLAYHLKVLVAEGLIAKNAHTGKYNLTALCQLIYQIYFHIPEVNRFLSHLYRNPSIEIPSIIQELYWQHLSKYKIIDSEDDLLSFVPELVDGKPFHLSLNFNPDELSDFGILINVCRKLQIDEKYTSFYKVLPDFRFIMLNSEKVFIAFIDDRGDVLPYFGIASTDMDLISYIKSKIVAAPPEVKIY
ncbi:MAG: ArsR family transcriptional regulator [Methanobacteriota archaeon]|nr:MAG: ArsR family transcriptional regulator [Euryarchaeota archaeon]